MIVENRGFVDYQINLFQLNQMAYIFFLFSPINNIKRINYAILLR